MLRILDFLAFADIFDVLVNCNLLEHTYRIAGLSISQTYL